MSAEDLKHIDRHIESTDPLEREALLEEKIIQISLIYADKKFQEFKKEKPEYKFHEAIKSFTPICGDIQKKLFRLENLNPRDYKEKLDAFWKDFFESMNSVYEAEGLNMDKMLGLIRKATDSIVQYLGLEDVPEKTKEKKDQGTKIIRFNDVRNIDMDDGGKWAGLKKLGFSNLDHLIEVHVTDFYKTDQENLGLKIIEADFATIAVNIIDKSPEIAAIVGSSWLLSTPLLKRLGFKEGIEEGDSDRKENNYSTWAQFVDKDGQINKKRFSKFCETGELPFKSIKTYIPVEEFLRRYLPADRRGKVVLKKLNKENESLLLKLRETSKLVKRSWEDLLVNSGLKNLEGVLDGNSSVDKYVDFEIFINSDNFQNMLAEYDPEDRDFFLNFIRGMYDKRIHWSDFDKFEHDRLKEITEKMKQKYQKNLYEDKEMFIDAEGAMVTVQI